MTGNGGKPTVPVSCSDKTDCRISCWVPAPLWTLPPAQRCPGTARGQRSMDSRAWAHTGAAEHGRTRRGTPGRRTRKVNVETSFWTVPRGSEAQCGRLCFLPPLPGRLGPWVVEACHGCGILVPMTLAVELPLWSCDFLWQRDCAHEMRPQQRTASRVLGGIHVSFPAPALGTLCPWGG